MHPLLQPKNLSSAPLSYRALVRAAADTGRHDAWASLQALSHHNRTTGVEPRYLLPVIYATLDPGSIPNALQLDSATPLPNFLIHRVVVAIKLLTNLLHSREVPDGACLDLWLRLWPWVQFIDLHRNSHRDVQDQYHNDMYMLSVIAMFNLQIDTATADRMRTTPGFRTFVGRAWSFVIEVDDILRHVGLWSISELMEDIIEPSNPADFREVLAGIDSGILGLATLLVKQLNLVDETQPGDYDSYPLMTTGAVGFIQKTENNPALCDALLLQGVVPALMTVISKLAPIQEVEPMLMTAVQAFMAKVQAPPGYPWMAQALQAGLLNLLLRSESLRSASLSEAVGYLLRDGLPRSLVYYPVVVQVSRTLEDAIRLASAPAFQASPLFPQWRQFVSLAAEYIRVLREYQAGGHEKLQICNNDECLNVSGKDVTRRCSVCQLGHYCSEHCQRADWQEGNHRADCARLSTYRIREPEQLSARGRSFLCALVRAAYAQNRMIIYLETIGLLQLPGEPICLVFAYTSGRVDMTIQRSSTILKPPVPAKFAAQLAHQFGRVENTEGRTRLVVVTVAEAPVITPRIIALRYRDMTIPDALWTVAQTVSPAELRSAGNGAVAAKIVHLLNEPLPVFSFASA
ncbi:hypothetical protein C8R43DRAFT_1241068 [Mycena crocata]|nr:hypothetical protein C8R43DRAFT_1241068 [Mycena crocata]